MGAKSRIYLRHGSCVSSSLSPEADPILDSVASAFGGDPNLAVSELLIAHESIESFLDEVESL